MPTYRGNSRRGNAWNALDVGTIRVVGAHAERASRQVVREPGVTAVQDPVGVSSAYVVAARRCAADQEHDADERCEPLADCADLRRIRAEAPQEIWMSDRHNRQVGTIDVRARQPDQDWVSRVASMFSSRCQCTVTSEPSRARGTARNNAAPARVHDPAFAGRGRDLAAPQCAHLCVLVATEDATPR